MKLYALTNMYCDGIHAGIQCQHSTVELLRKYTNDTSSRSKLDGMVEDWADHHKTTVLIQGGNHQGMKEWLADLEHWDGVPFAEFYESGMNYCLSSISLVCSTEMVEDMADYRNQVTDDLDMYNKYGAEGSEILKRIALARTV